LQLASEELAEGRDGAQQMLEAAVEHAQAAIRELRELSSGVHPAVLSTRGLMAALEELAARAPLPPAIRPVPITNPDGSDGVDLYLDQDAFPAAFAGDVDPDFAHVMAVVQRPFGGAALAARSGPPAWKSIPSWYLLGTDDKAIPPATQRFMAERANSRIEEVAASHVSYVSQPDVATRLILTAVEATSRRAAASA
jgi:pimeloyl-ACP methyl ester carboxylesterase